ncbi:MAG: hypothetical protein QXL85_05560 [Candidatus Bathyarchaeia archaeon]
MRLKIILDLYALKIKVFFGAFRGSKASIALLLIYVLGLLPNMFGLSLTIVSAVNQGCLNVEFYTEILAAVASALIAAVILLSLRGLTAFEYEQNIIFTSSLHPREFLVAGLLANLTYLLIFTSPLIVLYALIVFSLGLPPLSAAIILLASLLFVLFLLFIKTFLSLVRALYRKAWISILMLITAFLLIFPAVGIFSPLPLKYGMLPYPSSLFARILINSILYRSFHVLDLMGLALSFIVSFVLLSLLSERNFFPLTSQIPLVSPFDVSVRTQTLKMESNIKFFSRVGIPLSLNLRSKSLLGFLTRKEIIRIMREGSLFAIILIYVVFSIIFIVISIPPPGEDESFISTPILLFSIYSLIIPVMLAGNWRILESENLWLPISSGANIRLIIEATLYGFIIISLAIPLAIILPISIFYRINPVMPLTILISTSLIGCSANLYTAVKFLGGKRSRSPSFLVGWLSMLLSALLLSPAYILAALSLIIEPKAIISIAAFIGAIFYSAIIMKILLNLTENNIRSIEI